MKLNPFLTMQLVLKNIKKYSTLISIIVESCEYLHDLIKDIIIFMTVKELEMIDYEGYYKF